MDFFDLIKELRKGAPDIGKAQKAMKILGWISVGAALWNFAFAFFLPFEKIPFQLPPHYPLAALVSLLFIGALFFLAAGGIREMEPWGKKTGQIAILLLLVAFLGLVFFAFPIQAFPANDGIFPRFLVIFSVVFVLQLAMPAYYGVRYLGRLPTKAESLNDPFYQESLSRNIENSEKFEKATEPEKYKEALLPLGIFGTFVLFLGIPLAIMFFITTRQGDSFLSFFIMPFFFIFLFCGPAIYNYVPSSFQKSRTVDAYFVGGSSIFLFSGSWPFFKLLVYKDGVEIRVMFHRFFIPYDKMEDIPDKIGFFNRGVLIKSNLPGVPSGIRFSSFGMKKIVETLNKARNSFLQETDKEKPAS
ncbi:MAG: hypothetical protein JXB25_13180 [Deltaproteobacteria bacterium]|nr:hypothetical protein [Deltaproteobacteria bacterium]